MQKKVNVKQLCFMGVMVALYVVFDYLATLLGSVFGNSLKISLSGLPVILTAVLFGPLAGTAVGLVGSFIGQMMTYGFTATTLLWILPAGIRGLSMGLLFLAFRRSTRLIHLSAEVVISSLLVTAANTLVIYLDSKIYHYYSAAVVFGALGVRIITGVATAIVFALLLPPILKAVRRFI